MSKWTRILICSALALSATAATAAPKSASAKGKGPGSKAQQLLLIQRMDKVAKRTLVAELNRNRDVYGAMTPQQRRDLREKVYSFLRQNPDRQVRILQAARELLAQTPVQKARSAWLAKVVASLSAEEKDRLRRMSPAQRAKRLLELKAKLVDKATSAAQPATNAAPEK